MAGFNIGSASSLTLEGKALSTLKIWPVANYETKSELD